MIVVLPLTAAVVLAACSDDGPTAAESPSASAVTTPAAATIDDRVVAERFVTALNDRDAVAADEMVAPGAPIAVSPLSPSEAVERDVTLTEQIAWLAAWDWRWEDVSCDAEERFATPTRQGFAEGDGGIGLAVEFDGSAHCQVTARTVLGDVDDVAARHTISLWLLDGTVTRATWGAPRLRWMPSFPDFQEWAETERTELWAQAWNDDGPLLTESSAEVEEQLLGEYIGLSSETRGSAAMTSIVFPSQEAVLVADASGAAATGGTPLPDVAGASLGDDGGVRRPLGAVSELSDRARLDFLYERGGPGERRPDLFRDAVFVNPDDPGLVSAGWAPDRPFVVRHGFVNDGTEPLGPEFDVVVYAFQMELPGDGGRTEYGPTLRFTSDYVLRGETDRCGPTYRTQTAPVTCEWFVNDFPDGLPDEGRWALWAFWQAPCRAWVEYGFVDECADLDEILALFGSGVDSPWQSGGVVWNDR